MSRPLRDYTAYGLRLRSPIALPFNRLPDGLAGEPDAVVRLGATPASLPAAHGKTERWQTAPGRFLLNIDDVARYYVADGRDILVERRGGSDHDLSVYFTGSVLAALLQQRGVVTLHASAVRTDAGAALFLGASGAGKSSVLAALVKRGYPMMCDDVAGVVLDGDVPTVLPAFPCTRLWDDVLNHLAWWPRAGQRVRKDMNKHLAPVDEFHPFPAALRACFVLAKGDLDEVKLGKTAPREAFLCLSKHSYRKKYLPGLGRGKGHFRTLEAVARQVPVIRATRPAHSFQLDSLAEQIDGHLQGQGACFDAMPLAGAEGGGEATALGWRLVRFRGS